MKISKQFEEAVYVLLIIASQENGESLKSSDLSSLLEVSDSSLKKLLRKLVVAGFIDSYASKDGGFNLIKPIKEVSLGSVLQAIEGEPVVDYKISNLAEKIFDDQEHIQASKDIVMNAISSASDGLLKELNKVKLSSLVPKNQKYNWTVDWKNKR
ncbi:Rrf2 family transcriptional regulator [Companilactobacillus jidongensis]|uniref:Rrf2 family transcriptional regulator n=1 Tax=Companilactobacillus jidongensis TaxID=2486006 RepID=UPI000F79CB19|nr:Rrf2 family transcriptional regulator [Companilactobacillus jidongensis]